MNTNEVYEKLKNFYSASNEKVSIYSGLVELQMLHRTEKTKVTRDEVHAALEYKINKQDIRQIDPWTIIITF
jgi:hypothetical protein